MGASTVETRARATMITGLVGVQGHPKSCLSWTERGVFHDQKNVLSTLSASKSIVLVRHGRCVLGSEEGSRAWETGCMSERFGGRCCCNTCLSVRSQVSSIEYIPENTACVLETTFAIIFIQFIHHCRRRRESIRKSQEKKNKSEKKITDDDRHVPVLPVDDR